MTKKVEIYTTPTCTHCKHTKEFFKENNVEYTEHNVLENKEDAKMMIEKTGQQGVPVIVIDGNWDNAIIGFNEPELKKQLNLAS